MKLLVARAVRPGGAVVLNADDPLLVERGAAVAVPVVWFSLEPARPDDRAAPGGRRPGGGAATDGLCRAGGGQRAPAGGAGEEMPAALGGAARHNVANALAAVAAGLGPRRADRRDARGRSAGSAARRTTTSAGPT